MELFQLRYFLDAAETEHFTKSAERLHIAQPSLTKNIRNLEKELGVPLFLPNGRNVKLSEYGVYLRERLLPIVSELDALPRAIRRMADVGERAVRLNVLAASAFLTDIIVEYKGSHPSARFEFVQSTPSDDCDIQIITAPSDSGENENEDSFVCREKIFVAVPNTGKYKDKKYLTMAELEDEDFVSLSRSRQFRSICDKMCRKMGIVPSIVFESDSPVAVKNMISANMGVGFWPEFTWGGAPKEQIILLPVEKMTCSRDIIVRRRRKNNPAADDFFAFVKEYCERLKES